MIEQKVKIDKIELIGNELREKFHANIRFVIVECTTCHASWGVNPGDSKLTERHLVCRRCALDEILKIKRE